MYILALWGCNEGCDYTIGCNMQIVELVATNLKDAVQEAEESCTPDEPDCFDEDRLRESCWYLERATLAEVKQEIDVEAIFDRCRKLTAAREKSDGDDEERAEYERLKAKFGD